jgi:cysteine-rich repeat protein
MARALLLVLLTVLAGCGGSTGPSPTPSASVAAVCGNGRVEPGEDCDDANADDADGCYTTCRTPVSFVSSDVHVHSTGCYRYSDPGELKTELQAQGIRLGAALVWGTGFEEDRLLFTGRDHPVSDASFLLHYDMEVSHFPAAKTGHLLLLGLDSLQFSADVFAGPGSGVPVVEWARRQPRAVVGLAHGQYWPADGSFPLPPGGCCMPWDAVAHIARERLDFLSTESGGGGSGPVDAGTFRLWKAAQNSGFRVAIAGGSDWGCITQQFGADTPRTDVIVEGPLTYEAWLQGIKAGRTTAAISPGSRLNLRVEGRGLGEELRLAGAQDVAVALETVEAAPTQVEVLVNGEPVARVGVAAGVHATRLSVAVSRSAWISARSPHVLTSPVYVLVGGQPIRASAADACYLWRAAEHVKGLVASGALRVTSAREETLAAYDEAMAELQRRFAESGGVTCG